MNLENYIKSNIAKNIVSFMLKEAGYTLISLRSEDVLDQLAEAGVNKSRITKIIFNTPSYIVVDKKKKSFFLTIKFKSHKGSGRNIDWGIKQLNMFWPGSVLVVVTDTSPYFYLAEEKGIVDISKSFLKINKKSSNEYARLIKRYFSL